MACYMQNYAEDEEREWRGAVPVAVVCATERDVTPLYRYKGLAIGFVERPGELLDEKVQLHAVGEVLGTPPADESLLQH